MPTLDEFKAKVFEAGDIKDLKIKDAKSAVVGEMTSKVSPSTKAIAGGKYVERIKFCYATYNIICMYV